MRKDTADSQLNLIYGSSLSLLKLYLEEHLGRSLILVLTENSTTMLSVRVHDHMLHVRLHRMFLNADKHVLDEIVSYLIKRKSAMPLFRSYLRENKTRIIIRPTKKIPIKTAGTYHDLRDLYDSVNKEYFGGLIKVTITWGSKSPRSSVKRRTLGSYNEKSDIIRINPVLDRKTVPSFFVAFIVYHEMLHASLGTPFMGVRRIVHSQEFKRREKLFSRYTDAIAWAVSFNFTIGHLGLDDRGGGS